MDGRIQNAQIVYRVWKYCDFPMEHCLSVTISYVYDIYLKRCEGYLFPFWKVENTVTYQHFREILSSQMISYNPVQKLYPGDHNMGEVTKLVKTQQLLTMGEVT